jgi:ectoine hydroxylase-related dioxygenase (phytanoyl-CoA dioxygenase family)
MIESNIIEQTNIVRFSKVFDNTFCDQATKEILEYKKTSTGKNSDSQMLLNVNNGCWMGMPQNHGGFSESVEIILVEKILDCANKYISFLTVPNHMDNLNTDFLDKSKFHVHAWCNVNSPESENFLHSHPGNFMSGVVWLQAEETGILEFVPNNYLNKLSHPAWPYHGISRYDPKDGDILIFPSYLLHRVTRNKSAKERISLAFDISFAEK